LSQKRRKSRGVVDTSVLVAGVAGMKDSAHESNVASAKFVQRWVEWVWGAASESLDRSTILHSDKCETENRCACRCTSEIRRWSCGFMRRTGYDSSTRARVFSTTPANYSMIKMDEDLVTYCPADLLKRSSITPESTSPDWL